MACPRSLVALRSIMRAAFRILTATVALLLGLLGPVSLARADFINGDFQAGLESWQASGSVSVVEVGGFAQAVLQESPDATEVSLSQIATVDTDASRLTFR